MIHAPFASALAPPFVFVGERLWLDFINTDDVRRGTRVDVLRDFEQLIRWLEATSILDGERAGGIRLALSATHNLAEGAGAASLAAAMKLRDSLAGKKVVCVMSGGNIDQKTLSMVTRSTPNSQLPTSK